MRLVFAGTPEFSVPALDALAAAGHDVAAVLTQPDRPAGRGRKLRASPVAERAAALGVPVHKPASLKRNEQMLDELRRLAADAFVVVAYGLILPQAVLDIPPQGCLNIHASLLPRWRGAAPIQRAIQAGDRETGVTIMRMERGLDTGPMLMIDSLPIHPETTAGELHDGLSAMGARLIVDTLAALAAGRLEARDQPEEGVTYASKIDKAEACIDWSAPSETVCRQIHAFNPWPGAWSPLDGERIKLLRAESLPHQSGTEPGTVLRLDSSGMTVACGQDAIRVLLAQRPGAKPNEPGRAFQANAVRGLRFKLR